VLLGHTRDTVQTAIDTTHLRITHHHHQQPTPTACSVAGHYLPWTRLLQVTATAISNSNSLPSHPIHTIPYHTIPCFEVHPTDAASVGGIGILSILSLHQLPISIHNRPCKAQETLSGPSTGPRHRPRLIQPNLPHFPLPCLSPCLSFCLQVLSLSASGAEALVLVSSCLASPRLVPGRI
jgi:hypothetical protein